MNIEKTITEIKTVITEIENNNNLSRITKKILLEAIKYEILELEIKESYLLGKIDLSNL